MPFPLLSALGPLLGGLLSAGGGIAGSILGGSSGGSWDFKERKYLAENQFKWLVEGAKRAGIHPLAALGSNAVGNLAISPGMGGGYGLGSALAGAGDALGNAFSGISEAYEQDADARARAADRAALDRQTHHERALAREARSEAAIDNRLRRKLIQAQIDQMTAQSRSIAADRSSTSVGGAGRTSWPQSRLDLTRIPGKVPEEALENQLGDTIPEIYNWGRYLQEGVIPYWRRIFRRDMRRFGRTGRGNPLTFEFYRDRES